MMPGLLPKAIEPRPQPAVPYAWAWATPAPDAITIESTIKGESFRMDFLLRAARAAPRPAA
jgi:hypothetical protein